MTEFQALAQLDAEPTWIGADGVRIGWALGATLAIHDGVRRDVELPGDVLAVAASPRRWTVVTRELTCLVDPAAARIVSLLDPGDRPVQVLPGTDELIAVCLPVNRRLRIDDGAERFLPDGALRSTWLRPWLDGGGAAWVDGEHVYRVDGDVVRAIGRVVGVTHFHAGPGGAVIVEGRDLAAAAAPGKLLVTIAAEVEIEDARFAMDGERALAEDDEGAVEIELASGAVTRHWEGDLVPVGYAPGPVLWDVEAGRIVAPTTPPQAAR